MIEYKIGFLPLYLKLYDDLFPEMREGMEAFSKTIQKELIKQGKTKELEEGRIIRIGKIQNEDLNDGRFGGMRKARHPFINSELGQYMDHLKGFDRKDAMKSKKIDLTTKQTHAYWKDLK